MKRFLSVVVAVATLIGPTPVRAGLEQEADIKVQERTQKTLNGAPNAKQEEYGEKPNGLILERYKLDWTSDDYRLDVEAANVGKNNQSVKADGGQPGKMTWRLGWDQTPHLYSNEARSLYTYQGDGILKIADPLRQRWQDVDTTAAAAPANFNSFTSTGVRAALDSAPYVPLGLKIETGNVDLRFHPLDDLTMAVGAWRQTKRGTKAKGASFGFSAAIEVPTPIDEEVDEASLDIQLAKKDYQLGFSYRLSEFNNKVPNMFWDNPRLITDRYNSGSGYIYGDQGAKGGMAMAPDNKANSLNLTGGVDLPLQSRFSAELGYELWTAFNPMLPFTQNSAIVPGAAVPAANTAPFNASDPANQPDPNVQSKMEVFTQTYKFSSRPLSWLRGSLTQTSYLLRDQHTVYKMPGFVRFDQAWEVEDTANDHMLDVRKDKTALNVDYDVTAWLAGNVGLSREYNKRNREVDKNHENTGTVGFTLRPSRNLFVNASYLLGLRRGGFTDQHYRNEATGAFEEAPGLRRFDVADRNRNQGRVQAQWTPGEASYSLSARVTQDAYRPGQGWLSGGLAGSQDKMYGLLKDLQQAVGTDVSVPLCTGLTADGYYEFDFEKRVIQGQWNGNGLLDQLAAEDYQARVTENSHIAGLSLTWLPVAKLKTVFGYDIVSTRNNSDPLALGTSASVAGFRPLETTRRMQQTLKARAEYKVLKSLTLAANYMYEKLDVNDYAEGNVPLRSVGNDAIYLGASLRNYYAHAVSLGANYRF